jgi:hypothetical protein
VNDAKPLPSDEKHSRDARIWAVVIIAIGALCAAGGMLAQGTNQGRADVEARGHAP